jgi:hypothetical protein
MAGDVIAPRLDHLFVYLGFARGVRHIFYQLREEKLA